MPGEALATSTPPGRVCNPPPCYTGHRRTPRLSSHPRSRGLASAPPVRVRIPAAGPPATPVTNRIGSTLPHTHHHSLHPPLPPSARSLPSPHPTQPAFPPYLSRISPSVSAQFKDEKGSSGYFHYTSSFVLSSHHYQPSPHPFLSPLPSLPSHLSTSIPFSLAHPPTLPQSIRFCLPLHPPSLQPPSHQRREHTTSAQVPAILRPVELCSLPHRLHPSSVPSLPHS